MSSLRRFLAGSFLLLPLSAAAQGCSDPVPPTPQGAMTYTITNAEDLTVDQKGCTISGAMEVAIGEVDGKTKASVQDGKGAAVSCTVRQSGDGFSVTASISDDDYSFYISGTAVGGKVSEDAQVSINIVEKTAKYSGTGCTISLSKDDGSSLAAASGRIWGAFTCDSIVDSTSGSKPYPTCAIRNDAGPGGYFVFENCSE